MANASSVSTTWEFRRVKIRQRRRPPGEAPPEASSLRRLAPWKRRERLTLSITYRGGNECWYEIEARGKRFRRPGWVALEDLMSEIYNDV